MWRMQDTSDPEDIPSLKRKDFESSEASRTPILYCKSLLGWEDGKGTNVLYGDGRIEYVTAAELEETQGRVRRFERQDMTAG